jgi:hypothetical protein
MPDSWHCDNIYSGDSALISGQDCVITASTSLPALKISEDLTFSNAEINHFLPKELHIS